MKRLLLIFTTVLLLFVEVAHSEEENIQPEDIKETELKDPIDKNNELARFISSSEKISQISNANENIWVDVKEHKNLVLKHVTQYKNKRGNVLIFHAQGENALHTRLIQPLTKQLLTLGWNVFIPNIMKESFPKKVDIPIQVENIETENLQDTANVKKDEQSVDKVGNAPNKTKYTFENLQEYQVYFNDLCSGIFDQTKILDHPLLIITNQHSAYWSIECLKLAKSVIPVVFLQPESPLETNSQLKNIFLEQSAPFFSFAPINKNSHFSKMLKQGFWLSKSQRFNERLVSNLKLEEQNYELAKKITGWVESQRKLTQ